MSKKKIISLCLVVCLLATAIGGTLAYFTDTGSAKNTFTVGNVDIKLTENDEETTGLDFKNVMPGTEITKKAVVTNNSSEAAYVRVVVRATNQEELYALLEKYDEADIFKGWDFTFDKVSGMRYTSTRTPGTSNGVELIAVDEGISSHGSGNTLISADNYFKTDAETNLNVNGFSKDDNRILINTNKLSQEVIANASNYIYYQDLVGVYKPSCVAWIFYLKMAPNTSYTLFEGINVPTEIDAAADMAFFNGLEINVCADAIQSTGFTNAKAAFEALNEAHPLSAWNLN